MRKRCIDFEKKKIDFVEAFWNSDEECISAHDWIAILYFEIQDLKKKIDFSSIFLEFIKSLERKESSDQL